MVVDDEPPRRDGLEIARHEERPSRSIKIWFSHPRLFSDVMRFANRSRVVEWLEVEIDAALEKRLLSGR